MSINRCVKATSYLEASLEEASLEEVTNKKICIFSDSKGRYIKEYQNCLNINKLEKELKINWNIKSGLCTGPGLDHLEETIDNLTGTNIILLWYGTCDLATLDKSTRQLRPNFGTVGEACDFFNRLLQRISRISNSSPHTLIVLEIPRISIRNWNELKSYSLPEDVYLSDNEVNQQIDEINALIRTFNTENSGISSPRFGLDLEISRKDKRKTTTRKAVNFNLLLDGIHPNPELSKLWMIRTLKCISSV